MFVLIAENIEPRKPKYFTSKISDVRTRPKHTNCLYSALRGPAANAISLRYWCDEGETQEVIDETREVIDGQVIAERWRSLEPLYLYHGERFCLDRESTNVVDQQHILKFFNEQPSREKEEDCEVMEYNYEQFKIDELIELLESKMPENESSEVWPIRIML